MADTFDHVGIAVKDLEQALGFYRDIFGLNSVKVETYTEIKTTIAYLPMDEFQIHLLTPTEPGAGAVGPFVEKKGGGLHHIGIRVDDIERTVEKLKTLNIAISGNAIVKVKEGLRVAITVPDFTHNVAIELVEKKP